MILRNSVRNPTKNSKDLQRDLATAGVNVDSSTIRRRLLQAGRNTRRPHKKQLLTAAMKKKRMKWAKKYKNWRKEEKKTGEKSSDQMKDHFEVHGPKFAFVQRSAGEPMNSRHVQQAPKYPKIKWFGAVSLSKVLDDYVQLRG